MSTSKPEAGQLIIDAFKVALDSIDNFVGNDGPTYERIKRGLDAAEEFFKKEQPQPAEVIPLDAGELTTSGPWYVVHDTSQQDGTIVE